MLGLWDLLVGILGLAVFFRRSSSRVVDFLIFLLLAGFIAFAVSGGNAISEGCTTGCGLAILLLLPFALVILMIGVIRNRVWRDWRFWFSFACNLVVINSIVSGGVLRFSPVDILLAAILTLIPAFLLWQVITAAPAIWTWMSDRRRTSAH